MKTFWRLTFRGLALLLPFALFGQIEVTLKNYQGEKKMVLKLNDDSRPAQRYEWKISNNIFGQEAKDFREEYYYTEQGVAIRRRHEVRPNGKEELLLQETRRGGRNGASLEISRTMGPGQRLTEKRIYTTGADGYLMALQRIMSYRAYHNQPPPWPLDTTNYRYEEAGPGVVRLSTSRWRKENYEIISFEDQDQLLRILADSVLNSLTIFYDDSGRIEAMTEKDPRNNLEEKHYFFSYNGKGMLRRMSFELLLKFPGTEKPEKVLIDAGTFRARGLSRKDSPAIYEEINYHLIRWLLPRLAEYEVAMPEVGWARPR